ncbi:hypothetical protein A2890_00945 [candidate division WWE3 bacterium RIFCSPLOWO2_01_FULL_53_14]|uniref:N-acetyltransferase domain-containing protein n=1 Tax=candidate division WWE3 bacterium RIFCSPLOWO2_01_FULL_53_14 TaxID=1802628 RepID=A0A1F4VQR6_UNCKA|nr:MAG: hypothetical protein A2890_00945 [candidate division WWE3 bacterium RIFCSPLOWO2_01_FULL_53_14]
MDFLVEQAYANDVPAIQEILRSGKLSDNFSQCRFVLKAERVDGRIIGGIGIEFWDGFVSLRGLIVAKGSKRQGVGKALVAEAVELVRRTGAEGIYAYTLFWNQRFFYACGFVRVSKENAPAPVAASADFHYPHYKYCCLMKYEGGH